MKKSSSPIQLFCILLSFVLQNNSLFAQCVNADFENGTLGGWTGTWGDGECDAIVILGLCTGTSWPNAYQYNGFNQGPNNQAPGGLPEQNHFIMTGGYDQILGGTALPVVHPSGSSSLRLGNAQAIDGGETVSYSFTVNASNANFTYHYAVVVNDGGHGPGDQAYFKIRMWDGNSVPIDCATYDVDATTAPAIGGFTVVNNLIYGDIYYKSWTSVFIPLSSYMGQTVRIEFITRDCDSDGGSHFAYAYLDAECSPLQIISSSPTVCGGQNVTLTAPSGAATYSWTGPGVLPPGNTQTATINMAGHYTVTMTTLATVPCTFSLDTIIPGSPGNPVANFSAPTVCEGNLTTFSDLSTPAGSVNSWAWDFNNDGTPDATAQYPTYTFPAGGTYPVRLIVGWTPCIDDTTINVVVSPAPTSTFTVISPLCAGENSTITYIGNAPGSATYTWDFAGGTIVSGSGQGPYEVNWSTSGTKNITLAISIGSCASGVTTVPVIINLSPTLTVSPDVSICTGGSTTLIASGATTYDWSPTLGLSPTNTASVTATPASTTTYTVTGTTAGCTATATVTVSVNLFLTSTFTAASPLCTGQISNITYTGNASASATYSWSFDGGTILSGSGQGPYDVNWQTPGAKNLTLTVSENGCTSTPTSILVTVNQAPVSDAGADVSFCSGGNAAIGTASTAGYTYSWAPATGLSSSTASNPTVDLTNTTNGMVTTNYIVTTTGIGCFSMDTVAVTVIPIPVADFIPPPAQCASGNSFSFSAGGTFLPGATFAWDFQNGTPSTSSQQNPTGIEFFPPGNHTVSLTITQNGCVSAPFTADITVYSNLTPNFSADTTLGCGSLTVNFSFLGTVPAGTVAVWGWGFGDGGTSSLENPTHTYTTPGIYNVVLGVTSSDSCSASVVIPNMIRVAEAPVANFSADNTLVQLPDAQVNFTNESQFALSYLWDFGDGGSSTLVNPSNTYTSPGTYLVTLYAMAGALGCEDSITKEITVKEAQAVYIPTAFSPNGDGVNDFFRPKTKNANITQVTIYNRWGEKVFETNSILEVWDGYYKGDEQPIGVYAYVVTATFIDESEETYSGNLTLVR